VHLKTPRQLALKALDLPGQPFDHLDERAHHLAVGFGDHRTRLELRRLQRVAYVTGAPFEIAASPARAKQPDDPSLGEPFAKLGRRGSREHGAGLERAEVREGGKRTRVVLPQVVAKRVGLPRPRPDEALVASGKNLHCLRELGVPGHLPVVLPVGAHEVGEHLRVTGV
jgi:hypothetical protein